jgi:hypothetical protein
MMHLSSTSRSSPARGPSLPGTARRCGLLVVVLLLVALVSCRERAEYESLLGTWQLDVETQEWLPRACVVLDYEEPMEASFEIERRGEEYRVRLTDRRGTTFHGHVQEGVFDGRQLLPTSATGRFCGSNTMVRLRLILRGSEPGTLRGIWETPACDVCSDRHFGAERTEP